MSEDDGGVSQEEVESLQRFIGWLGGQDSGREIYPRTWPQAMGMRCLAMLWVLHPDRMPWAMGIPQTVQQVAKQIGVSPITFSRALAQVRELGLQGVRQRHGLRRGKASQTVGKESFFPIRGAGSERGLNP